MFTENVVSDPVFEFSMAPISNAKSYYKLRKRSQGGNFIRKHNRKEKMAHSICFFKLDESLNHKNKCHSSF